MRYWWNPSRIKAGGRKICSEIHKLIISIGNKDELLEEWKESIIVPIYKSNKTDCSDYRNISLLTTTYKILSNILVSRLSPYAKEIIADCHCGFWCEKSTTDHIFCIRQILGKNGNITKQCISSLQTSRKLTIQLGVQIFGNNLNKSKFYSGRN